MQKVLQVLVGDVASKGILFLVNLALIRVLPVSEYAKFSLLFNAILLGHQLVCSGIDRLYIADHREFEGYSHRVLCVLIAVYSSIFLIYLHDSASWVDKGFFMIGLILLSVYQFRRIVLQQQLRFAWLSLVELIKNGGWLLAVIAVYASKIEMSSDVALCTLFASVVLGLVVMPRKVERSTRRPGKPAARLTFSFIFGSKHVFLYALFGAVLPFLPIIMANHTRDAELLATYGAAMRYQAVLGIFVYSLNTVCLPTLASSTSRLELLALIRRFHRTIPLAIAVGVVAIAALTFIIPLIDGGKYPKLPLVFVILSGCPLLSLAAVPLINFLLVEREYKAILTCMVLGLVVNIISYALMQGRLGGSEIAVASFLGYGVVNILLMWLGWEKLHAQSKRQTV